MNQTIGFICKCLYVEKILIFQRFYSSQYKIGKKLYHQDPVSLLTPDLMLFHKWEVMPFLGR